MYQLTVVELPAPDAAASSGNNAAAAAITAKLTEPIQALTPLSHSFVMMNS